MSYTAGNYSIQPVSTAEFTESFTTCEGIICGAGFETPAEALQMGKKLLVIPMKHQYEQHLNAAGAKDLGVAVIKSLKKKQLHTVENWLKEKEALQIHFPDDTERIVDLVLSMIMVKTIHKSPAKGLPANNALLARWI